VCVCEIERVYLSFSIIVRRGSQYKGGGRDFLSE